MGAGSAYAATTPDLALTEYLSRQDERGLDEPVSRMNLATVKSDASMPVTGYRSTAAAGFSGGASTSNRLAGAGEFRRAEPAPVASAKTLSLVGHLQSQYGDLFAPKITSGYGYRRLRGYFRHHDGLDIALPYGAPIKAAWGGKVVYSGWKGGYGRAVIIDHGDGKETLYAHASKLYAVVGQSVGAGDVIAKVGTSGHSYGPHIHFELRVNGNPVNPRRAVLKIYSSEADDGRAKT